MNLDNIAEQLLYLPVTTQYELAIKLASNCGYRLVAEDSRSLEIKELIKKYKANNHDGEWNLVIEGLEALLK